MWCSQGQQIQSLQSAVAVLNEVIQQKEDILKEMIRMSQKEEREQTKIDIEKAQEVAKYNTLAHIKAFGLEIGSRWVIVQEA